PRLLGEGVAQISAVSQPLNCLGEPGATRGELLRIKPPGQLWHGLKVDEGVPLERLIDRGRVRSDTHGHSELIASGQALLGRHRDGGTRLPVQIETVREIACPGPREAWRVSERWSDW